jgi:hypothetical protein
MSFLDVLKRTRNAVRRFAEAPHDEKWIFFVEAPVPTQNRLALFDGSIINIQASGYKRAQHTMTGIGR